MSAAAIVLLLFSCPVLQCLCAKNAIAAKVLRLMDRPIGAIKGLITHG